MFKTNVKLAWRHLIKDRFYSLVNIIGLSSGIGFALLIAAYVWTELHVNSSIKDEPSQYIIQSRWNDPGEGLELTTIGPLAKALKEEYPGLVKNFYRWDGITTAISKGVKSFREGIQIGDSTLLDMYGFHLLYGDPRTAFEGPFSMVLTKDMALKYFGHADVVGETLTVENFSGGKHDFVIRGVMEKPPKNSVTVLTPENDNEFYTSGSSASFFGRGLDAWDDPYIASYVELQKGVSPESLLLPMQELLKRNANPKVAAHLHPHVVSLKQYYLSANNGLIQKLVYSLSVIAFFILCMAVINYINLSISRASRRLKEIGIRKVLGGRKQQLMAQFLLESTLLSFMSTLVGLAIYVAGRLAFGSILNEELPGVQAFLVRVWPFMILLVLATGIAAGLYPAFVLSSLRSVESLKGKLSSVSEKVLLRKSLVGFQFLMATLVLTGAIVVSQQVRFFFSQNLGYNKDYVLSLPVPRNWTPEGVRHMEAVRAELAQLPRVKNVSLSYEVPAGNSSGVFALYRKGADPSKAVQTQSIFTDEYYANTYSIPLVAGSFYGEEGAVTDSSKLVINERMSRALGFNDPRDALGAQVMNQGGDRVFTVAGVTRDFHFGSMHEAIRPMTFYQLRAFNAFRVLSVKLKPGDVSGSLESLYKKWKQVLPGAPFEYTFMDDSLKALYRTEIQLKQASSIATILSIIIVLLGVLGLVSQNVQKKTKEIGIRKVLGSSVKDIIGLFMKEILWTILVAGTAACPIAYLLMHAWLQGYAYRIILTPTPFVMSVFTLGVVTAALVTAQTIKTALANPVDNLRTE